MVLESLMSVRDAVRNPWHMVVFGFVISIVSFGVSYLVFPDNAGLVSVFLVTIISAPFMLNLLRYEESMEERKVAKLSIAERLNPLSAFSRQREVFVLYSAFFAGLVVALVASFLALPQDFVERLFSDQITKVGDVGAILGGATASGTFSQILTNNLAVLCVSFVFALLLGIGAIFILAWNASVLAAAIGIVAKTSGLTPSLVAFLPHGVFEIAAYFIGGIAGGIISMAVSKRGTRQFLPLVGDMLLIMVFSVALLVVAAYIESPFTL